MNSLGKLTIPWVWTILLSGGWSLGSVMIIPLKYVFPEGENAEYISYLSSAGLFLIIALIYAFQMRNTLKHKWPNPKIFIMPFILSSFIMALPWITTGYFFEVYRCPETGGNWMAIAIFTALAVIHAVLLTFLLPDNS